MFSNESSSQKNNKEINFLNDINKQLQTEKNNLKDEIIQMKSEFEEFIYLIENENEKLELFLNEKNFENENLKNKIEFKNKIIQQKENEIKELKEILEERENLINIFQKENFRNNKNCQIENVQKSLIMKKVKFLNQDKKQLILANETLLKENRNLKKRICREKKNYLKYSSINNLNNKENRSFKSLSKKKYSNLKKKYTLFSNDKSLAIFSTKSELKSEKYFSLKKKILLSDEKLSLKFKILKSEKSEDPLKSENFNESFILKKEETYKIQNIISSSKNNKIGKSKILEPLKISNLLFSDVNIKNDHDILITPKKSKKYPKLFTSSKSKFQNKKNKNIYNFEKKQDFQIVFRNNLKKKKNFEDKLTDESFSSNSYNKLLYIFLKKLLLSPCNILKLMRTIFSFYSKKNN